MTHWFTFVSFAFVSGSARASIRCCAMSIDARRFAYRSAGEIRVDRVTCVAFVAVCRVECFEFVVTFAGVVSNAVGVEAGRVADGADAGVVVVRVEVRGGVALARVGGHATAP